MNPRYALVLVSLLVLPAVQYSFATPSLAISTDKKVYEYGDYLSINFQVSETSKIVSFRITTNSTHQSTPINFTLNQQNTTITSPFPFSKMNYSPGTYKIDAQYDGATASTSFDIIDSGKIVIPPEFKSLVGTVEQGSRSDAAYSEIIRALIHTNILSVPGYSQSTQIHIPHWFKNNFKWWADGSISDNDLGTAIEYLMQNQIIQV